MKIQLLMGYEECEIRNDPTGDGHFGASRGKREHNGTDFLCQPGGVVVSPVHGLITKIGYPYGSGYGGLKVEGDEKSFRYVQVTTDNDIPEKRKHHRIFYIEAQVSLGQLVRPGNMVGVAMDVSKRYPEKDEEGEVIDGTSLMKPHLHYEIMSRDRSFEDPEKYVFPRSIAAKVVRPRRGVDG